MSTEPFEFEPWVTYEIWQERDGTRRCRNRDVPFDFAVGQVERFNAEEAENAAHELRPVRARYFVVKSTATLEEVAS